MSIDTWMLLSNVVTVIGLPLAIAVFFFEQRKERENEEEEVYQLLSDSYQDFLKVALQNPDLRLFSEETTLSLNDEQKEKQLIIYIMLVALFEGRSYCCTRMPCLPSRRGAGTPGKTTYLNGVASRISGPACRDFSAARIQALCAILNVSLRPCATPD